MESIVLAQAQFIETELAADNEAARPFQRIEIEMISGGQVMLNDI